MSLNLNCNFYLHIQIVELLKSDSAKINKETGILTWDVKLNAGETKKFKISYKVKYPKDKFIDNL